MTLKEVGEAGLDAGAGGLERLGEVGEHRGQGADGDLTAVTFQDLYETAHVGALGVLGQADREAQGGDGALGLGGAVEDGDGVAQAGDSDLFDRDVAVVGAALEVGEFVHGAELGGWWYRRAGLGEVGGTGRRGSVPARRCGRAR